MDTDEIQAELRAAAADRKAAEAAKAKATRRLVAAAKKARGRIPMRQVAAEAGISVQGLYDLLEGRYRR